MPPKSFRIEFTSRGHADKVQLERSDPARHRKVLKTLAYLQANPRHPGLKTHKFKSLIGPGAEEVFAAYVESNTPAAYRLFWCYKRDAPGVIVVIAITPHP